MAMSLTLDRRPVGCDAQKATTENAITDLKKIWEFIFNSTLMEAPGCLAGELRKLSENVARRHFSRVLSQELLQS